MTAASAQLALGTLAPMDENRARQVADGLRDRGIDAYLENGGVDIYGVRVVLPGRREAIWGNEGTRSRPAEVLLDGDLFGFMPKIPGSESFDVQQDIDAIARADYSEPVAHERAQAPAPAEALPREGGVFRRFLGGLRYDPEGGPRASRG